MYCRDFDNKKLQSAVEFNTISGKKIIEKHLWDPLSTKEKEKLEKEKKFLKKRILWYSLLSAAAGAVPVPGVDITADLAIFYRMIVQQREHLGLTNQELETAAEEMGFDSKDVLLKRLDKGST